MLLLHNFDGFLTIYNKFQPTQHSFYIQFLLGTRKIISSRSEEISKETKDRAHDFTMIGLGMVIFINNPRH